MAGRTGKRVSARTHLISVNGLQFAISEKQAELHNRAAIQGGVYVTGSEVRSARKLASIGAGTLRDDGPLGDCNLDGERWFYSIANRKESV